MTDAGQTRFLRCKLAAFDVFTDIMREYMVQIGIPSKAIFDNIMKCSSFKKTLNWKEFNKIQTLKTAGFQEFDISLMYKIVKHHNFAMIIPDKPTRYWGSEPLQGENSIGDNINRIVNCRNDLVHKNNTTIQESKFKELFEIYIDIGKRAEIHLLKIENYFRLRIEKYKTCCIDKDMEEKLDKLARENEELRSKFSNEMLTCKTLHNYSGTYPSLLLIDNMLCIKSIEKHIKICSYALF